MEISLDINDKYDIHVLILAIDYLQECRERNLEELKSIIDDNQVEDKYKDTPQESLEQIMEECKRLEDIKNSLRDKLKGGANEGS